MSAFEKTFLSTGIQDCLDNSDEATLKPSLAKLDSPTKPDLQSERRRESIMQKLNGVHSQLRVKSTGENLDHIEHIEISTGLTAVLLFLVVMVFFPFTSCGQSAIRTLRKRIAPK